MSARQSGPGAYGMAPLAILALLVLTGAGPAPDAAAAAAPAVKAATAPAAPANVPAANAAVPGATPGGGAKGAATAVAEATPAKSLISVTGAGNVAIKGYDPVAYFLDERAEPGSPEISYQWEGATWHFASLAHRAAFVKNPRKYAPQYGGYSAYGISRGQMIDSDPTIWSVVDGKLYLNRDEKVRGKWLEAISGYIDTADANWQKLRDSLSE